MTESSPTVYIVDDDEAVRDALQLLVSAMGYDAEPYPSATSFLETYDADRPGCLLLDIKMPGMSGIELQSRLNEMGSLLPIIFISGHGDVPAAVSAMRSGAVDFIEKPFTDSQLRSRIDEALGKDERARKDLADRTVIVERRERLTPREREVMTHVVAGKPNKVIAMDLGVSERTIEIHRSRVMKKMEATSLAHLVKMNMRLDGGAGKRART